MSFSPDDIRPGEFDEGKAAALERDLKWLRARKSQFVEVDCPACGSQRREPAFQKYGFDFAACRDCATVYMTPRATAEMLNAFYAGSALYDYWNRHVFPASREVRRERVFKPRIERLLAMCRRHGVRTGCLVEVGAGYGIFCEEIAKSGAFDKVVAIEPSSALAETCRGLGLETIEDSVDNVRSLEVPADVVASFETIEHLFSPKAFLENCKRLLAAGGIVAVTCPNYEGFDIRTLGVKSDSLDAEHINLFNPASLRLLFERCGFAILECATPGELDAELVRDKCLAGELSLEGQPFLKTVLVDGWEELGAPFQAFLKAHGLSSHMWLAARLAE